MKKIICVVNYFYPDVASTGQLMTELCMDMQNDFDITVIAAQPGYAGEDSKISKLFEEDYLGNIKIIRIRLPKVNKSSKISRLKYIFSYFILAIFALLKERGGDIVYTISQPPILGGLIGTIGKFLKRTKHIYTIQDFNPEQASAIKYTSKKFIFDFAKRVDKLNCSYANHVIVVGQDMSETLKKRFSYKNTPQHTVINNWTSENEIIPLSKNEVEVKKFLNDNNLQDKFIVMYSGNIGLYYDLENIIKLTKYFTDYEDLAFVFIGEGAVKKEMELFVNENGISNVYFLPYQPKEFIKYSLNAADIHLVVNQKGIKGVSVPSKIYGVMAAGKAVLGVLEKGSEVEMLINNSKCGIVVEPHDYQGIADSISYFYNMKKNKLDEMGINGRLYLEQYLKRETSINKYRKVFNETINQQG